MAVIGAWYVLDMHKAETFRVWSTLVQAKRRKKPHEVSPSQKNA